MVDGQTSTQEETACGYWEPG